MQVTQITVNAQGRAHGIAGYLVNHGYRFTFRAESDRFHFTVYADADVFPVHWSDDAGLRGGVESAGRETGNVVPFRQVRAIA